MNEERCQYCKWFFVDADEEEAVLECRRYAPRMICGAGTGFANWEWPKVNHDSYCGEFERIPTCFNCTKQHKCEIMQDSRDACQDYTLQTQHPQKLN